MTTYRPLPKNLTINAFTRTPLGGFINHSERPNCKLSDVGEGRLHLFTTTEIEPGGELTLKYKLYIPKK